MSGLSREFNAGLQLSGGGPIGGNSTEIALIDIIGISPPPLISFNQFCSYRTYFFEK